MKKGFLVFLAFEMLCCAACHRIKENVNTVPENIYVSGYQLTDSQLTAEEQKMVVENIGGNIITESQREDFQKTGVSDRKIRFCGKEYPVEYLYSYTRENEDDVIDCYSNRNDFIDISIDEKTGRLMSIFFGKDGCKLTDNHPRTEEDFRRICSILLDAYGYGDEYRYSCETQFSSSGGVERKENSFVPVDELQDYPKSTYWFQYVRYIDNIATTDYIYIMLNKDGFLNYMKLGCEQGLYASYDKDTRIDTEQCDQLVSEKFNTVFKNTGLEGTEYQKNQILILKDNQLWLSVTLQAPEKQEQEGHLCNHFELRLLLPLETKGNKDNLH